MLSLVLNLPSHSIFGRTVGSLSCVVGLLCYALSSSFKFLFGEWNPTKIILYTIISSIVSVVVLFAGNNQVLGVSKLKRHVEFLVLMLTSLYSFFADRSTLKPDILSVVSSGAFAITSLCLSRQINPGFDVGLFSFFLGCVTVQLMKIHLIFILVAAGFCYPLVVLGSYSESKSEKGDSSAEGSVEIRIDVDDDANRASVGMGQDEAGQISPRRRVRNTSSTPLTQDTDRRGLSRSVSNISKNLSAEGSAEIRIDDDDATQNEGISNPFRLGQDEAAQIGVRRRVRYPSPSPDQRFDYDYFDLQDI